MKKKLILCMFCQQLWKAISSYKFRKKNVELTSLINNQIHMKQNHCKIYWIIFDWLHFEWTLLILKIWSTVQQARWGNGMICGDNYATHQEMRENDKIQTAYIFSACAKFSLAVCSKPFKCLHCFLCLVQWTLWEIYI